MSLMHLGLLVALWSASPQDAGKQEETQAELLPLALGEDRYLAEDARDRFLTQYARDARRALRDLQPLDTEQRTRLRLLMQQAEAEVRWDLACTQLPAEERKQAARFYEKNRETVWALFGGGREDRVAAVESLPRERGSIALVLLIDDSDYSVVDAALDAAIQRKDPGIGPGAERHLNELLTLAESGYFKSKEPAYEIVAGQLAHRLVQVLRACQHPERSAIMIRAMRYFARRFDTNMWSLPPVFEALAETGDVEVSAVLLPYLRKPGSILRVGDADDGRRISRFMSDAALEALLTLYKQPRADYGFLSAGGGSFYGFLGETERRQAIEKFLDWYERNHADASDD